MVLLDKAKVVTLVLTYVTSEKHQVLPAVLITQLHPVGPGIHSTTVVQILRRKKGEAKSNVHPITTLHNTS